jgi:hypothetical protein
MIGYDERDGIYLILDVSKRKVIRSRDVTFNELATLSPESEFTADPNEDYMWQESSQNSDGINEELRVASINPTDLRVIEEGRQMYTNDGELRVANLDEYLEPDYLRRVIESNGEIEGGTSNSQPNADSSNSVLRVEPPEANNVLSAEDSNLNVITNVSNIQPNSDDINSALRDAASGLELRRTSRESKQPDRLQLQPNNKSYVTMASEHETPATIEQALESDQRVQWQAAIDSELNSIKMNEVWTLVPRTNQRVIGCRWLFKVKRNSENQPIRYKARLVAKGYTQKFGVDYHETFAPVVKIQSLRAILAIAAACQLHVHQIDIDTAFLNGELNDVVHLEPPPGSNISTNFVCRLRKTLYGLKQSPHEWNQTLVRFLTQMGYKQTMADVCVLFKGTTIIAIYVDDILIIADNLKVIQHIKDAIASRFDIKDLKQANLLLGINFEKLNDGSWQIHQRQYIREIMELFSVNNMKTSEIPMQPNLGLTSELLDESEDLRKPIDMTLYRQAIGKLMYLMVCTRPDISFAVSVLSRFMAQPREKHWRCVIQLLKYLNSTQDLALTYPSGGEIKLTGYSDSDHAGDTDDRKSTSGYVFVIGQCCVSWRSVKQKTVSISSTEAEYIALSTCAQEALWLRLLLRELGHAQTTTVIFNDNLSSHQIVKGSTSARSKHIDVRHHFIRDHVAKKELAVNYMSTHDLPADVLTKALNKEKHESCVKQFNLINTV